MLASACSATAVEDSKILATDLKDNIYETSAKLKEWALTPPEGPKPPNEIVNSYCYYVYQDILCYHQAMPGLESHLVGYQGTHAQPPAPYKMELMPKREVIQGAMPMPDYAANAKPVFIDTLPPPPKKVDNTGSSNAPIDAAHELLPDPVTSPQM